MLLDKKDNTYNIDKTFDYFTIKAIVIESLEKIVRQELNRHIANINLHKIDTHMKIRKILLFAVPLVIYLEVRMTTTINYQHHY